MSSEWRRISLSEITESLNTGLDAIRRAPIVEYATDIRCLRIQDISQGKPIDKWGYTEVKDSDYKKYRLVKNDIIMARTCSTGINYLVKKDLNAVFNNGLARIRLKVDLADPEFMYYVFQSKDFANYINGISGGTSVQLNMKVGDVAKYEFVLPPMKDQKEIAKILRGLDEKIELNCQINKTLEQTAQAIFKSWFVNFGPVKAKIAAKQNGQDPKRAAMLAISGKADEELDQLSLDQLQQLADVSALFPDELVDSEFGEIPKGWEVSTIGDEVDVLGGGTPSTKNEEFWEGGEINWTSPKDLSGLQDKILVKTEKQITEAGLAKISSGLLPIDTVLMSSRAPVGYLAQAKIPVAINQGYIAMKCEKRLPSEFVLLWTDSVMDEIKQRASGSTFAEISKKNFRPISIVVPDSEIISVFQRQAKTIYNKITESVLESATLIEVRDLLLPRLLSGQIEVQG